MKRLTLILTVAMVVLACGRQSTGTAGAALVGCFGPPADYVAAFDTVRGQSKNNQVDYPQARFWHEWQTWVTPRLATPGHHSEHVHEGACVPQGQTLSGQNYLDVGYVFHNVTDYKIDQVATSAVTQTGSSSVYTATQAQTDALQAAMEASGAGAVSKAFQSYPMTPPTTNGLKEYRGGVQISADGPTAVFQTWRNDKRWYATDNWPGLPGSTPLGNQQAIRNRTVVDFPKAGDPSTIQTDYHHSGWCGMNGNNGRLLGQGSSIWTRATVATTWQDTQSKRVCVFVTDGGGPAMLMIDPDFHNHYDAPTASCPNVDSHGNCLGKWFWVPDNARHEMFGLVETEVTIPASVIASLAPGVHKLVFKSDDFPECVRAHNFNDWNACPPDVRGSWSNVQVLPFKVT